MPCSALAAGPESEEILFVFQRVAQEGEEEEDGVEDDDEEEVRGGGRPRLPQRFIPFKSIKS